MEGKGKGKGKIQEQVQEQEHGHEQGEVEKKMESMLLPALPTLKLKERPVEELVCHPFSHSKNKKIHKSKTHTKNRGTEMNLK